MNAQHLFRWLPASISLWIIATLFALFGFANLWVINKVNSSPDVRLRLRNVQGLVREYRRGAIENEAIAALLVTGWFVMRRATPGGRSLGALLVLIGFWITYRRWLHQAGPSGWMNWVEPFLIWPLMLYPVCYGFFSSQRSEGKT